MSLNKVTSEMLEMLPSWMKIRSDSENSQGAKFINAVGVQLNDIELLMENILSSHHPTVNTMSEGVDVTRIDLLYKVNILSDTVDTEVEVSGILDGLMIPLTRASTIYNFYKNDTDENLYYLDANSKTLYIKRKFEAVSFNNALHTEVFEHNVWGPYDEIGLLIGCQRIPGERNFKYICNTCGAILEGEPLEKCTVCESIDISEKGYRARLMKVFSNKGNASKTGLANFISSSLGINKEEVILQELDDEFIESLTNPDGTIKAELKEYFLLSNKINLETSNVYWEVLEESQAGLNYLPIIWNVDLSKWSNSLIQNGVGDTDDLEIIGPEQESILQKFNYHVGVEGLRVAKEKIYPQHEFEYRLFATGHKYDDGYSPENYKYSVVASEAVPLKFKVKAHKNYTIDTPADMSGSVVDYTAVTDADKKLDSYVVKNVVIQSGDKVMNPNNRYVEILANLSTTDKASTPLVDSISLKYTNSSGVEKIILVDTESEQSITGNTIKTGFDTNTWNDASPVLKVRNDSNDNYNIITGADGKLTLAHGEYQSVYNSEGDWDDGERINLRTTANGTLKLSI